MLPKFSHVTGLYINDKGLRAPFRRLVDDYVSYEKISNTYYNAKNVYSKDVLEGQNIAVEKLAIDSKLVLLFNCE